MHPGEVLQEEFPLPLTISAYRLAKDTRILYTSIRQVLKRKAVFLLTALRLSQYFGTTPKFRLGLQADFDIEEKRMAKGNELLDIRLHTNNAA